MTKKSRFSVLEKSNEMNDWEDKLCSSSLQALVIWFILLLSSNFCKTQFLLKGEDKQHQIIRARTSGGTN